MVLYQIDNIKKLVDLNNNLTNFELTFVAKSIDNKEYEAIVVDQTTLDKNNELNYKKVRGEISGKVVSNKNIYQNYFLILRSDTPCSVDVNINIIEIPPVVQDIDYSNINRQGFYGEQEQLSDNISNNISGIVPNNASGNDNSTNNSDQKSGKSNTKKYTSIILIFLILIAIGCGGYFYIKNKGTSLAINPSDSLLEKLNSFNFD